MTERTVTRQVPDHMTRTTAAAHGALEARETSVPSRRASTVAVDRGSRLTEAELFAAYSIGVR